MPMKNFRKTLESPASRWLEKATCTANKSGREWWHFPVYTIFYGFLYNNGRILFNDRWDLTSGGTRKAKKALGADGIFSIVIKTFTNKSICSVIKRSVLDRYSGYRERRQQSVWKTILECLKTQNVSSSIVRIVPSYIGNRTVRNHVDCWSFTEIYLKTVSGIRLNSATFRSFNRDGSDRIHGRPCGNERV